MDLSLIGGAAPRNVTPGFDIQLGLDELRGMRVLRITGHGVVDALVESPFGAGFTGVSLTLPTSPQNITLSSSNAGDTAFVAVTYLNSDWYERLAIFQLAGLTPVTLAAFPTDEVTAGAPVAARRINDLTYFGGGSGVSNAGVVSCTLGGNLVRSIGVAETVSLNSYITVPAGQHMWTDGFEYGTDLQSGSVTVVNWGQPNTAAGVQFPLVQNVFVGRAGRSAASYRPQSVSGVDPATGRVSSRIDFGIRGIASGGTKNVDCVIRGGVYLLPPTIRGAPNPNADPYPERVPSFIGLL